MRVLEVAVSGLLREVAYKQHSPHARDMRAIAALHKRRATRSVRLPHGTRIAWKVPLSVPVLKPTIVPLIRVRSPDIVATTLKTDP